MIKFIPLLSGSSGNAAYIGTENQGLLIDAGGSCKAILAGLRDSGIPREAVRGILITHEHTDHIKGLKVLCRQLDVPVMASWETLDIMRHTGAVEPGTDLVEISAPTQVADMEVTPFDIPHDAVHPLGFRIDTGQRVIGYATDLGTVTPEIWQMLQGCHLVMLEANYEPAMLRVSGYPRHLKMRIASPTGHLSNEVTARCISDLAKLGTARFVLGHLSRENNHPDVAAGAVRAALLREEMEEGRDFLLTVARRQEPTPAIVF